MSRDHGANPKYFQVSNLDKMRTFKEFNAILEKFKPFPEDSVSRQIARKEKKGSSQDANKMKVAKNFMTKPTDNNHGERAITTITKNKLAMIHQGGTGEGHHKDTADIVHKIIDRHVDKSKLQDLDIQSKENKNNKETKKKLNKIYRAES